MTCLNQRIASAMFLLLSGYALAQGSAADPTEAMTVANVAPMSADLVAPIPEPQRYLHSYEMEYRSVRGEPAYAGVAGFYSADILEHFRFEPGQAALTPGSTHQQQASRFLDTGPSTAPQLSIVQLPDPTFTIGAQPQRRLSLTVNTWVFSATARVALLHSHQTGATITVKHKF
jgi:hypothetical protein